MDKELKDSIDMLRNTDISTIENAENIDLLTYSYAVKTVLNYIENSIPKQTLIEKIRERQFELQQEYKDFKDDIKLNTLQELLEVEYE